MPVCTSSDTIDNAMTIKRLSDHIKQRHFENDWLIVLATLVVFFFHCARFFNGEDWSIKNPIISPLAGYAVTLISQWIMPLFFFLSGMSSEYSLRKRPPLKYLKDRTTRLMIPFIFSTLVASIPLQVWIERVSHGQFSGSFWKFYPLYFNGFYAFGGNFAWMGLHLWYLAALFLFSALTLPFFRLFDTTKLHRLVSALLERLSFPGGALALALPLLAVEFLVNLYPNGLGRRDFGGWSLLSYLTVFCMGYILSTCRESKKFFRINAFAALFLALGTTTVVLLEAMHIITFAPPLNYPIQLIIRSCNSWLWLTALYGLGCRYLTLNAPILPWLRETALPFYIVHQTVIVSVGFCLLNLDIPIFPKYILLASISFISVLVLLTAIRRLNWLRPLFGMQRLQTVRHNRKLPPSRNGHVQ